MKGRTEQRWRVIDPSTGKKMRKANGCEHEWLPQSKDEQTCPTCGATRTRMESWTWQHQYTANGKRRYKTGTARTKKLAQEAMVESLSQHNRGEQIEPSKDTVTKFLRDWLELVKDNLKPGTFRSYHDIIEHRLVPHLGDERLSELRAAAIAKCYAELRTSGRRDGNGGLSPTSIQHTHRVLHSALSAAVQERKLARNPADDLKAKPKRAKVEMVTWSPEQTDAFLASLREHRLHSLFFTAAMTACRRGEVLGLRWDDVDLTAGRLSIRRSRVAVGYEVHETTPKTDGSVRVVDIGPATVAELHRWRKTQKAERLAWGEGWTDSGYVFTRENGEALHPHQVADAFDAAVRRAKVPTIRFHDLRHGWATTALRGGVSPKIVSERLGHASIAFTLDVYCHAVPGWQAEAAATVEGLVFGGQA